MTDDAPNFQQALDDRVAALCRGVAHPHRIAVLRGIQQEAALTTVATALDLSRSGVQTHVDTLVDTDLVIRTGDQRKPYRVTVLGTLALHLVQSLEDPVRTIEHARRPAADQAEDELGDAPLAEAERTRTIHRRTWNLVAEELVDTDLRLAPE